MPAFRLQLEMPRLPPSDAPIPPVSPAWLLPFPVGCLSLWPLKAECSSEGLAINAIAGEECGVRQSGLITVNPAPLFWGASLAWDAGGSCRPGLIYIRYDEKLCIYGQTECSCRLHIHAFLKISKRQPLVGSSLDYDPSAGRGLGC